MKQTVTVSILVLYLISPLASAGVVMDMVTRNAAGTETDRSRIYAQSNMIRLDEVGEDDVAGTMLFIGNELLYVDHREKSYIVMDEAMLDRLSAEMSDVAKQMEAQLANLPPEQRAMAEQMMRGRMPGMIEQQGEPAPAPRVEAMGSGEWQSYKCREYAVYEGGEKTQQVCASELDEIDGADEVIDGFRNMAAYMTKMTESMPMRSDDRVNPGELMDQIGGFPVHTIDYENGVVAAEISLDLISEQDLEPDLFAVPDGYRRQDPFSGR